jgi:hypothetical protein
VQSADLEEVSKFANFWSLRLEGRSFSGYEQAKPFKSRLEPHVNKTLWEIPVPATGLVRGPDFKQHPQRQSEISFSIEGEDGSEKWLSLFFEGVQAHKCTYLYSLSAEMMRTAYGKVVSIEDSDFLRAIRGRYNEYCHKSNLVPKNLQHFMICFDDGPCYEFVCEGFKAV